MSEQWEALGYESFDAMSADLAKVREELEKVKGQVTEKEGFIQKQAGELGDLRKAVTEVDELKKSIEELKNKPAPEPAQEAPAPAPTPSLDDEEKRLSEKLEGEALNAFNKLVADLTDEEKAAVKTNQEYRIGLIKSVVTEVAPEETLFPYVGKKEQMKETVEDMIKNTLAKYQKSATNIQPTVKGSAGQGMTTPVEGSNISATEPIVPKGGSLLAGIQSGKTA